MEAIISADRDGGQETLLPFEAIIFPFQPERRVAAGVPCLRACLHAWARAGVAGATSRHAIFQTTSY